jgi:two-component system, OmpR family, response regulator
MGMTSGAGRAPAVPLREDGSPARLLVVDDEESLADLLVEALSFQGYDVTAARTGLEALDAVEAARPDLIVLDVNMPGLDGFEVVRRLRSGEEALPVIMLTTSDDPKDIGASYSCGVNGYVLKPSRFEDLLALIRDLCAYWLTWNQTAPPTLPTRGEPDSSVPC